MEKNEIKYKITSFCLIKMWSVLISFQLIETSVLWNFGLYLNKNRTRIDLPSSLSTSFCNFWTERSANSARASAYVIYLEEKYFMNICSIFSQSKFSHKLFQAKCCVVLYIFQIEKIHGIFCGKNICIFSKKRYLSKNRYLPKIPRFMNEPAVLVWNLGKIYSHRKKSIAWILMSTHQLKHKLPKIYMRLLGLNIYISSISRLNCLKKSIKIWKNKWYLKIKIGMGKIIK